MELEKAKKGEMLTEDVIRLLESILDQDNEKASELEALLKEKDGDIEEVNKLLDNGKNREKTLADISNAEKVSETMVAPIKEAQDNLDKLKGMEAQNESIKKEAVQLEQTLNDYEEREQNRLNMEKYTTAIEKADKTLSNLEKESAKLDDELLELTKEKNSLSDTTNQINQLSNELKELQQTQNTIRKIESSFNELDFEKRKLEELQNDFRKVQETYKEANALYEKKSEAYLAEQAGILAEALEEGQACPVCGSTTHPKMACRTAEAPTKEELQAYKEEADELREKAGNASELSGRKNSDVENIKKNITVMFREAFDDASEDWEDEGIPAIDAYLEKIAHMLDDKKTDVIKEIDIKNEALEKAISNEARFKKLEQLIPEKQDRKNKIIEEKGQALKEQAEAKTNLNNAEKLEKTMSEKLTFASKSDALKKINELNEETDKYKKNLNKAEENVKLLIKDKENLSGQIKALNEKLKELAEVDMESCQEKLEILRNEREDCRQKKEKIASRINANSKALNGINEKLSSIEAVERKYQMVKNLSDTANGNLLGKEKIKLETYVQAFYFDRVVQRANVRFLEMSGGHYELKRADSTGDKKGDKALDLSIIDHYTGTERSVKTLSGGESFEAALSMALAFSEEITESAGGIKLDTLFVDGGFGSLDEVSLVKAIQALENISEGNRLVGIISHVGELKKRIDKQIVVTKEKTGESRLEIVV